MRKLLMVGIVLALLVAVAIPSSALTIWYGGDPDMYSALRSQQGGTISNAMTYDNFYATGSGWDVYYLVGNFAMDFQASDMAYEIRSGVSEGNGGTLVSSGVIDVTQTATGNTNSDWGTSSNVYTLAGNTTPIQLAAGEYWIGMAPVIGDPTSSSNAFVATTSGSGGIGTPLNDGNSFFNWAGEGYNFTSTSNIFGTSKDFSYGVFANPVVPEPGSMLVFGMGLASFVPFLRRRK
jgi:hypothetical protein